MKTTNNIEPLVQFFSNIFENLNMFSVPLNMEAYGFYTREEFIDEVGAVTNDDTKYVFQVRVSPQDYKLMNKTTDQNLISSLNGIIKDMGDDRILCVNIENNFSNLDNKLISVDMFFEVNYDLLKDYKQTVE